VTWKSGASAARTSVHQGGLQPRWSHFLIVKAGDFFSHQRIPGVIPSRAVLQAEREPALKRSRRDLTCVAAASRVSQLSIQVDTTSSRFTWSVDREESLYAFAFTADSERAEHLVPACWSFYQVGSFRITLQPLVQFNGHRREKLSLVNSLAQMIAIDAAPGVPRWPDPDGSHELTEGVYNSLGNALGLFRARWGLFKAGV
jgi:hypothetical protein